MWTPTTTQVLFTRGTVLHITAYLLKLCFKVSSSVAPSHFNFNSPLPCWHKKHGIIQPPGFGSKLRQQVGQELQCQPWTLLPKPPSGGRPAEPLNLFYRLKYIFSYLKDTVDIYKWSIAHCKVKPTHQHRTGVSTEQNTSSFGQEPHVSILCSYHSCNNKAQAHNKAILFGWVKKSTYVSSVLRSPLLHHEEKFCLISDRTHGPLYRARDCIQNSPCVFVIWNKTNKHNFYSVDMNIWKMTSTWLQL